MRSVLIFLALALTASYAFADEVAYGIDGETFSGYYAPADNPRGLVLIVHDWDGLTDYERRRADMLAEAGYDAFTLDMFGEQTPTRLSSIAGPQRARSTPTASGCGPCFTKAWLRRGPDPPPRGWWSWVIASAAR